MQVVAVGVPAWGEEWGAEPVRSWGEGMPVVCVEEGLQTQRGGEMAEGDLN